MGHPVGLDFGFLGAVRDDEHPVGIVRGLGGIARQEQVEVDDGVGEKCVQTFLIISSYLPVKKGMAASIMASRSVIPSLLTKVAIFPADVLGLPGPGGGQHRVRGEGHEALLGNGADLAVRLENSDRLSEAATIPLGVAQAINWAIGILLCSMRVVEPDLGEVQLESGPGDL